MSKTSDFIKKRSFLKCLLVVLLSLILGAVLYLFKFSKNENQAKGKRRKTEIRTILAKADILLDTNKFESSYYYYNKAQLLCDTKTEYIDYVYAITCMAVVEQFQGDYVAAEILLTKTLPYLKQIKKPRFSANVYEQLGANYYYTFDYNNSLRWYEKALHLPTSSYRKIRVLNSICQIYIRQKKFKLAESMLIKLSKIKIICKQDKKINDYEYARILDDLGLCYHAQGKPEALDCYQKSVAIQLKIQDYNALLYSYMHIAEYFQEDNLLLAKFYAKKAYMISTRLNDATNRLQSLKVLSKTTEGNDLKKYSTYFIRLADSIDKARQKAKNQFALMKYNSKKDRFENLQLKAQKVETELKTQRQNNRKIISYLIILFTTALSMFIYFHLQAKSRKEKNKAILESEMRISKKLSDELTDGIFQTLNFAEKIDLEKDENKEKLLNNLDVLYSRTRNISKENSSVVTDENFNIALKEMISSFKSAGINIILNGLETISFQKIEKNKKITLYRILQELLLNMKKHSNASLAGINFKILDKTLVVNYTDNGKGIDLKRTHYKSGLQNVENRIMNIKGEINIESNPDKGFKVFIKFPI